jgi:hypothetical protein
MCVVRQVVDATTREAHDAACDGAPAGRSGRDAPRAGQRLARARFADTAQHFAGAIVKDTSCTATSVPRARREFDARKPSTASSGSTAAADGHALPGYLAAGTWQPAICSIVVDDRCPLPSVIVVSNCALM